MVKKAYISIEGNEAKIFISKGKDADKGEFYKVTSQELLDFIKQRAIKEVKIAQFIPNLIIFKFPLPFILKTKRNKRILNSLVINEIRKKYPTLQNFSFIYTLHEIAGRTHIRCYVADDESMSLINKLILEGVNVTAFYPLHLPIVEFINEKLEKDETAKLLCLFSNKLRMLFVLKDDEILLQRSFEAEEKTLTDEDLININMTISYSIQNLRINPEKVVFIGIEKKDIPRLQIPVLFIDLPENLQNFIVSFALSQFESKLKGKEMFLPEYKRYLQTKKLINYANFILILVAFLLIAYNIKLLDEIGDYRKTFSSYRKEFYAKEKDFLSLQESIRSFEKNLKPYLDLQNRVNSMGDLIAPLKPIEEASRIKGIEINSIDIENSQPQKVKISGKILSNTFTERQKIFINFKNTAIMKGLHINNETWDFTKGDFTLEGKYYDKRVLQK